MPNIFQLTIFILRGKISVNLLVWCALCTFKYKLNSSIYIGHKVRYNSFGNLSVGSLYHDHKVVCLQSFPRKSSSKLQSILIQFVDASGIFQYMPRVRRIQAANICDTLHSLMTFPCIICTDAKFTPITNSYFL